MICSGNKSKERGGGGAQKKEGKGQTEREKEGGREVNMFMRT